MQEQMQSARVHYTLLELLYRNREEELERDYPQVLALLSHHSIGFQAGIRNLRALVRHPIRLWGWAEDEVRAAYDPRVLNRLTGMDSWFHSRADMEAAAKRFRRFFIPVLPFSLVSDIVRFNDRRPIVRVIMEALLRGHQVTALTVSADPYHVLWRKEGFHHGTPSMKRDLYQQLQQLRSYGIQLVDEQDVQAVVRRTERAKRRVLSKADIVYAHEYGEKEIRITGETLVTPLAADLANEWGIRISRADRHI